MITGVPSVGKASFVHQTTQRRTALSLRKTWHRHLFIRQLRMDRITVAELRKLINNGQALLILDVRPKEICENDGTTSGARSRPQPGEMDPPIMNYPREAEIVVYCACPNESIEAATAAKHLKREGSKKIRPLLGGIDAVDLGRDMALSYVPIVEAHCRTVSGGDMDLPFVSASLALKRLGNRAVEIIPGAGVNY